jgi:hypothetical protein
MIQIFSKMDIFSSHHMKFQYFRSHILDKKQYQQFYPILPKIHNMIFIILYFRKVHQLQAIEIN